MRKIINNEVSLSDLVAIADDSGNKISYKELAKEAEKLAQYLEERSLIFMICDHQMETASVLYEILYLNQVPLLLSSDLDIGLLKNLMSVYQPQYIYCSAQHKICNQFSEILKFQGDHVLMRIHEKKAVIHPDIAVLLSTSGTTGSPKLVKLSYENLYYSSKYACLCMDIQKGQKGITPLPLNHVYGLMFCLWHWYSGASLLITKESVLSRQFNDFFVRERVNHFAATPYTYRMLQRIEFWNSEKLNFLHWAMSGGMQISAEEQLNMIRVMREKFWIGYGQTECTALVLGTNFDENNVKICSVGKTLDHVEAIVDPETHELILKSQSVCMGYVTNAEQLAEGNQNQGVLHTGDTAYIDEDGYIYLRGRLTRYIKILGKRISLDDLENYLNKSFENTDFACIGIDDHISIFYTNEEVDIEKNIWLLLERHMKIPKIFISCFYIKELPINSSGKIMYVKLKEEEYEGKNNEDL